MPQPNMFIAADLESACVDLLKEHFPAYLAEFEKRLGRLPGSLDVPKNYTQRNSFDALPGEEMPKCVVISPGVIGQPTKSGNGQYRATWRLGVGVALAATTEVEANLLADVYGAAIRSMVMHYPSIGGTASNTNWLDESYDDLPIAAQNELYKAVSVWFACDVNNVVGRGEKLLTTVPAPTVQKVVIDVNKVA